MATIDLSCSSANGSGFKNYAQLRITYTASNGTLTITEIAAKRSDGYRSYDVNDKQITVTVGGVQKTIALSHYVDFGANSWVTWGAADTSWSGLKGNSIGIAATMPSSTTAFSNATFNGNASMSWSTYTVSYNANGGSGAPSAQTKTYGTALTLSSTKPTRTGHSFKGWATSASGAVAYAAGASYTANAAITLYAVWEANTYTVSYNANGGTGAPANQTKTYGKALTLSSSKPTRENYNFLGWGTSAASTTVAYAAGASYTTNANITLYAVWELAYMKPRIWGEELSRCNFEGEPTNDGEAALISFRWECDLQISAITIEWKPTSAADYDPANKITVAASGIYGDVEEIISRDISADKTYTFRITVTDSGDSSYKTATLPGSVFPIDFLAPETEADKGGTAIGKPAELQGIFDVGYKTKFTGGILNIVAEKVSDLNDLNTPNTYVSINKGTETYAHAPAGLTGTFTIEVMSAGAEGQLLQRLTSCSKTDPNVYTRLYYQDAWGEWIRQFEVSLYNSSSGTTGEITLTESVENFEYIEIFYTDNNNKVGGSMKVYNPQGKTLSLSVIEAGSGATTYFRRTTYTVSGTTITPDLESAGYVRINTATPSHTSGSNFIKIHRVVGFERGFM